MTVAFELARGLRVDDKNIQPSASSMNSLSEDAINVIIYLYDGKTVTLDVGFMALMVIGRNQSRELCAGARTLTFGQARLQRARAQQQNTCLNLL